MRVLLQRAASGSVENAGESVAVIGEGVVLLVGFGRGDDHLDLPRIAARILDLRIFSDDSGRLQRSLRDTGGEVLAVPQFTLYARCDKGRRPDFTAALAPDLASGLFDEFVYALARSSESAVRAGVFGADMKVSLVNDGPMTIPLEFTPPTPAEQSA